MYVIQSVDQSILGQLLHWICLATDKRLTLAPVVQYAYVTSL